MELQHIHPLPKIKAWGDDSWEAWLSPNLSVVDTGKLFGGTSLAKVTAGSPIEKHHLDGFRDKPEQYWRANPDLLYKEDQNEFWKYALTDVKALLWSLLHIREFVWTRWHLDLLRVHSLAGLACRILESRLTEALEPSVRQSYLDRKGQPRTKLVFDQDLVEARRTALKAYQGGRREAYVMGRVDGPIYCYDFSKQYTVSALSIPLPTQGTKFERMKSLTDVREMVGWARVRFTFPLGVNPCIGVKEPRFPKLVFVREGETWTGVFSIRRALEKGARVELIDGWGFRPTENERNHPIHALFRELLELGKEYKGSFLEHFAKGLANMLVGRLIGKYDR